MSNCGPKFQKVTTAFNIDSVLIKGQLVKHCETTLEPFIAFYLSRLNNFGIGFILCDYNNVKASRMKEYLNLQRPGAEANCSRNF